MTVIVDLLKVVLRDVSSSWESIKPNYNNGGCTDEQTSPIRNWRWRHWTHPYCSLRRFKALLSSSMTWFWNWDILTGRMLSIVENSRKQRHELTCHTALYNLIRMDNSIRIPPSVDFPLRASHHLDPEPFFPDESEDVFRDRLTCQVVVRAFTANR